MLTTCTALKARFCYILWPACEILHSKYAKNSSELEAYCALVRHLIM